MNLSWTDNSSNKAGFKIERSTDNENFIQIATVGPNVTTFQDTGVSGVALIIIASARIIESYGNSSYSNVVAASEQSFYLYWSGGAGT